MFLHTVVYFILRVLCKVGSGIISIFACKSKVGRGIYTVLKSVSYSQWYDWNSNVALLSLKPVPSYLVFLPLLFIATLDPEICDRNNVHAIMYDTLSLLCP